MTREAVHRRPPVQTVKKHPQEFRARRREIPYNRFSRGVYVGKTPCAERASNCLPQADNRGEERSEPPSKKRLCRFLTRRRGATKNLRRASLCRYGHFPCPRICPGGGSGEYPRSGRQRPKTGRNARNWSTVRLFIPDPPRSFSAWRRERSWVLFENGQYAQRRRII